MRKSRVTADYLRGKYPKERPVLPPAFREVYDRHMLDNRTGGTSASRLSAAMESWMHRKVASLSGIIEGPVLELGAGTLNQLPYESPASGSIYDIVEPTQLFLQAAPRLEKVSNIFRDIREINASDRYTRITSVAVLEHVTDLPELIARCAVGLAEPGVFQAAIPSEGTWLWRLGSWYAGREFKRRYGLDYRVLMKHEHLNTASEVEEVLEYFFREVSCRVFGLSRGNSFYRYYECRNPDRAKAVEFIPEKAGASEYNTA